MKVPSRRFDLAGGLLVSEPRTKPTGVVQEHVIKHPFGVNSLARGGAWDAEDWAGLGAIDAETRAALITKVLGLRHGRYECSVPELRGATSTGADVTCKTCPGPLAEACASVTGPTVGARYLAVLEELLDAASGPSARAVPKLLVSEKLVAGLRNLMRVPDLVIGYLGLDARAQRSVVLRLNRGDGVRAEFFFAEPNQLTWRTLYRDPEAIRTAAGWLNFMGKAPPQASANVSLSELCLVSRPFWEKP